jgi:hypothetical protein
VRASLRSTRGFRLNGRAVRLASSPRRRPATAKSNDGKTASCTRRSTGSATCLRRTSIGTANERATDTHRAVGRRDHHAFRALGRTPTVTEAVSAGSRGRFLAAWRALPPGRHVRTEQLRRSRRSRISSGSARRIGRNGSDRSRSRLTCRRSTPRRVRSRHPSRSPGRACRTGPGQRTHRPRYPRRLGPPSGARKSWTTNEPNRRTGVRPSVPPSPFDRAACGNFPFGELLLGDSVYAMECGRGRSERSAFGRVGDAEGSLNDRRVIAVAHRPGRHRRGCRCGSEDRDGSARGHRCPPNGRSEPGQAPIEACRRRFSLSLLTGACAMLDEADRAVGRPKVADPTFMRAVTPVLYLALVQSTRVVCPTAAEILAARATARERTPSSPVAAGWPWPRTASLKRRTERV